MAFLLILCAVFMHAQVMLYEDGKFYTFTYTYTHTHIYIYIYIYIYI